MNHNELRLSPCGVPMDVTTTWHSAAVTVSRGSSEVSAASNRRII